MNESEFNVFNSGLILNYLLRKKSAFTLYLDDGEKLTGTLLGWDADFLLVKEENFLQMIRFGKIVRLQTDLEQLIAVDNTVMQNNSKPLLNETTKSNPAPSSVFSNFKPTLTEVTTTSDNSGKSNSREQGDPKNRLDQLVKNW